MNEQDFLASEFEENRTHLRAVAYRILGSLGEADDAVQECWLRLSRTGGEAVDNLSGWLTTVVARVCLDMLRSRKSRREDALPPHAADHAVDPEQEALMADSVGLALLVVLDRLNPAERLAFVLHDLFAVPFDDIAGIIGRSPDAARQLASRARRRVQGAPADAADLKSHRETVEAFLAALRAGDLDGLLAVLDPNLVVHADSRSSATREAAEIHGAMTWAVPALKFAPGARFARAALVDGVAGAVQAPNGHLVRVLRFTIVDGKITEMDLIGDPARIAGLTLSTFPY